MVRRVLGGIYRKDAFSLRFRGGYLVFFYGLSRRVFFYRYVFFSVVTYRDSIFDSFAVVGFGE